MNVLQQITATYTFALIIHIRKLDCDGLSYFTLGKYPYNPPVRKENLSETKRDRLASGRALPSGYVIFRQMRAPLVQRSRCQYLNLEELL